MRRGLATTNNKKGGSAEDICSCQSRLHPHKADGGPTFRSENPTPFSNLAALQRDHPARFIANSNRKSTETWTHYRHPA